MVDTSLYDLFADAKEYLDRRAAETVLEEATQMMRDARKRLLAQAGEEPGVAIPRVGQSQE